jgi:hypothetical protein
VDADEDEDTDEDDGHIAAEVLKEEEGRKRQTDSLSSTVPSFIVP